MSEKPYTLILGTKNWSSWSLRAWMVVRRSHVVFDEQVIQLRTEGLTETLGEISPSSLVPVLKHGDEMIWDSLAIAEYMAEQCPSAQLWPAGRKARALARSVSAEMHAGFHPLRKYCPMDFLETGLSYENAESVARNVARIIDIWDMCRNRYADEGAYLFGQWSIADAMYAPVVSRFRTYDIPLKGVAADYAAMMWDDPDMQVWRKECEEERQSF